MPLKNFVNVAGVARNVRRPSAKSAVSIDRSDPFGQELALRLLFLIVLSFHFQHEHLSIR